MFDKFEPFQQLQKQNFDFQPTRFETWKGGKMVSSGKTNSLISARVIQQDSTEKMEVTFTDSNLNNELTQKNVFDEFVTATDRLQLITIPEETNVENVAIMMFKMTVGATRQRKDFSNGEPFCCNLFIQSGRIAKVTFSYSNPEKLIEFYQDGDDSFKFHKDKKHSGHDPIIQFFSRNRFGSNNPVMTYLSVLSTTDRCIILEELYNPNLLDSILSDKLLLAYVTSGKQHLAQKVIENSIRNGESEINVWGLRDKLDLGLAPTRNRAQRLAIYNDFLSKSQNSVETEFLKLLIDFCNKHYE